MRVVRGIIVTVTWVVGMDAVGSGAAVTTCCSWLWSNIGVVIGVICSRCWITRLRRLAE
jgi:hypothetical protein